MSKAPAFMVYAKDWLTDPALSACSAGARGFWFDLLCMMHLSPERGRLTLNGRPATEEQVARMARGGLDDNLEFLRELEAAGVTSRDAGGVLFSRRMVRDEAEIEAKRQAGRAGGQAERKQNRKQKRSTGPSRTEAEPEAKAKHGAKQNGKQKGSKKGGFHMQLHLQRRVLGGGG